jgi:hypothetical protein
MLTISPSRSLDHGLDHAQAEYFAISDVAEGRHRELVQFTTVLMKIGADELAVRTALAAMCWHSSGGSAADAWRIRLAGAVDVRSLRTAWRLEAPGWLAQLYAGTLVSMDKDGRIIRTFVTEPRLPVTDSGSNTGRL